MRGSADASPTSSSLIAFKPRQVLLLQRNQSAPTPMAQLNSDDDSTLIFTVALWLKNKGFSKVLKRFLAEAQIQDDDWMTKALNLNEVFSKYQEICNNACKDFKFQAKQEENANGTSEEIKDKKKKKKKSNVESAVESGKALENGVEDGSKASEKSNGNDVPEVAEDQSTKKPKEKKKKKSKVVDESKQEDLLSKNSTKKADAAEDDVDESKKASKKRKRMAPDENEPGQEVAIEESKSKKSKGLEEGNGQADEQVNAENDDEMDKSIQKKSASKQPKSSEPTAVKAFQRVKIDEVEFVDERLQDNSYWAKSGAEIGYGAKAQEVLGQVKGRGFRHEKTKKKRGSYRGGQIDLQSHSIKFKDYDEE